MIPPLPRTFLTAPLAHRGLHDAATPRVENSRAAIDAALAAGYGIEIDVQLTGDGAALVFHDAELDRLTKETGPVRARTLADLQSIRLCGAADGPPELSEVVAHVNGRVPLLIEVKDPVKGIDHPAETLASAVARALGPAAENVAVMSFNPQTVQSLARLRPTIPRGLTTMDFRTEPGLEDSERIQMTDIAFFDAVQASFISHDRRSLSLPAVKRLRARGVPVLCWTVRSAAEASEARHGADNITFEGFLPPQPGPQA